MQLIGHPTYVVVNSKISGPNAAFNVFINTTTDTFNVQKNAKCYNADH